MANKNIFQSAASVARNPATDTVNEAGGMAYSRDDKSALAQFAVTGVFRNTYYTTATDQINTVRSLLSNVKNDPTFLAKLAVYARKEGMMKDMPACIMAYLASRGENELLNRVFHRVLDNGKMIRNFVQMVRSGVFDRKSFGYRPKRLIQEWFSQNSPSYIFRNSIGSDPSMSDVIKMVHPKPKSKEHEALFAYLLGKVDNREELRENLPALIKE